MPECKRCHAYIEKYSSYCEKCKPIILSETYKNIGLYIGDQLYVSTDKRHQKYGIITICKVDGVDIYGTIQYVHPDERKEYTDDGEKCRYTLYDLGKNIFFEIDDMYHLSYKLQEKYIFAANRILSLLEKPMIESKSIEELLSKYEPDAEVINSNDIRDIVNGYADAEKQMDEEKNFRSNNTNGECFCAIPAKVDTKKLQKTK